MKIIDRAMNKYGYSKTEENEYGVYYVKHEKQGFDHVVCVICKSSGKHVLQSYDKEVLKVNDMYLNSVCGVEIPVLLLMWVKAKYLSFKYRWKKQ